MNMSRRYVIFFRHIFSKRDYVRYECDLMKKRGYEVLIIQCGIALEGMDLDTLKNDTFQGLAEAVTPKDKIEFNAILNDLSAHDLSIVSVDLSPETAWLYLALAKRNLPYLKGNLAPLPTEINCGVIFRGNWMNGLRCYMEKCKHFAYKAKSRLKLIRDIGPSYFRIKPPLFWVNAGTWYQMLSTENVGFLRGEVMVVEGQEITLTKNFEKQNEVDAKQPYAVFIDAALCHHPDFKLLQSHVELNEETYHRGLCSFFDRIEESLGLRVIVSLHPKANYKKENYKELFGYREVRCGTTTSLIENCELALVHNSTATIICAFYNKPMIFLMNDELEHTTIKPEIEARSSWVGQPIVNMDRYVENEKTRLPMVSVENKLYRNFVETFALAPNAYASPIMDSVADHFERRIPVIN